MKLMVCALGLALASTLTLSGQVSVEVVLDQDNFLAGESMPAAVKIRNRSGQTLQFGADADWLTFSMESRDGFVVEKTSEVPVLGEFTLESSKMATRRVDLGPSFSPTRPGRYQITASVRVKEWGGEISSKPKDFNIVRAAKLWAQDFGVPPDEGVTNRTPEVRRYVLEQANYLRHQLRLYFRLTDADDTRVLKVVAVGQMVSISDLQHELDKLSNLHVLHRIGAHAYQYTVFNPNGEITLRQTYDHSGTRPRLKMSEDGKMFITGGARRATPDDLPSKTTDAQTKTSDSPLPK